MNPRIKELMEQASSNACYDEPNQLHLMNDEIEKFAELIVKECMRQIARQELFSHPEHKWEDKSIGYNEGIRAARDKIKKHFGVEE